MQRGRFVILVMLFIGCALAGISVVVHYRQGRRSLEYWGKDDGLLIRDAPSVLLVKLRPAPDSTTDQLWQVGGQTWQEDRRLDVTHRLGMLHVRMALLDDKSFNWQTASADCDPGVLYALVFAGEQRLLRVVLDTQCRLLRCPDGPRRSVSIAPAAEFFAGWIKEQMPVDGG